MGAGGTVLCLQFPVGQGILCEDSLYARPPRWRSREFQAGRAAKMPWRGFKMQQSTMSDVRRWLLIHAFAWTAFHAFHRSTARVWGDLKGWAECGLAVLFVRQRWLRVSSIELSVWPAEPKAARSSINTDRRYGLPGVPHEKSDAACFLKNQSYPPSLAGGRARHVAL